VTVHQFYYNQSENPIEANYYFPLFCEAAVCGFEAEIDGKVVKAVAKEKSQARLDYYNSVKKGKTAFLMEEKSAEIFKVSIGNVPAQTRVNVKITYVHEMDETTSGVQFVIPTHIAPRYVPLQQARTTLDEAAEYHLLEKYHRLQTIKGGSDGSNGLEVGNPPFAFSVYIELQTTSPLKEVTSPTHGIKFIKNSSSDKSGSIMFLRESEELDRDLLINIRKEHTTKPRAILEHSQTHKGSYVAMISFVPEFYLGQLEKPEFIFVVDQSGSMADDNKIGQTKDALSIFLRALPVTSHFNIIGFGSTTRQLFPSCQPYTEANIRLADQFVNSTGADLGGTELMMPLKLIYESPIIIPGASRQIFVLTDGEVSNTEEVIKYVAQNHQKHSDWRLFSLGLGKNVSHELVRGIAEAGRGISKILKRYQRVESSVMKQLKNAMQPVVKINDMKLDWGLNRKKDNEEASRKTSQRGALIGHRVDEIIETPYDEKLVQVGFISITSQVKLSN